MLSRIGCLIIAVITLVVAIIIAFLIYDAVSPPRPAHAVSFPSTRGSYEYGKVFAGSVIPTSLDLVRRL